MRCAGPVESQDGFPWLAARGGESVADVATVEGNRQVEVTNCVFLTKRSSL